MEFESKYESFLFKNAIGNFVCEMLAFLFEPGCVKMTLISSIMVVSGPDIMFLDKNSPKCS